jgi:DNA-binding IclR family transcriptional regulator
VATRDAVVSLTQSVDRALSILTCFTDVQPRLRVADLTRQLGLSQSTVSRLLATMESLGFVERDTKTGLYQLGLELVTLAGVALNQVEVRRQAIVELSRVAAELGLAANLAILHQDAIFYLATVEGPRAPKLFTMIGKRGPLHCTGMGKVLLASLPAAECEAILGRLEYSRFTPLTAGSPEELRRMLAGVRERGYATEREELALGRACVGAPIRDASGAVVAATSISGPLRALDLDRREPELAMRVIEMADHISHNLGYITIPPAPSVNGRARAGSRA